MNTDTRSIAIVDFGMGNLHSVARALAHASPDSHIQITADPAVIQRAARVVFPGQGAMPDAMRSLAARPGLTEAVLQACQSRPTLGICLGEQMLLDASEEGTGADGQLTRGLGLLPGRVVRFDPDVMKAAGNLKVPHTGWNRVYPTRPHPLWAGIEPGAYFYFVHSFYAQPDNPDHRAAYSAYGGDFTCAVTQNNMFAVQFHPEKSAAAGLRLFRNFTQWRP